MNKTKFDFIEYNDKVKGFLVHPDVIKKILLNKNKKDAGTYFYCMNVYLTTGIIPNEAEPFKQELLVDCKKLFNNLKKYRVADEEQIQSISKTIENNHNQQCESKEEAIVTVDDLPF